MSSRKQLKGSAMVNAQEVLPCSKPTYGTTPTQRSVHMGSKLSPTQRGASYRTIKPFKPMRKEQCIATTLEKTAGTAISTPRDERQKALTLPRRSTTTTSDVETQTQHGKHIFLRRGVTAHARQQTTGNDGVGRATGRSEESGDETMPPLCLLWVAVAVDRNPAVVEVGVGKFE